ncbi:MAG: MFS transporter, partial [Muribaculaceae bacterium]|nr:MFS transporter [Muribaculaceae bacterium]
MLRIKSGYGTNTLPLWAVFNLYVIFICTSIPGLAISPIMGDLTKIFPGTSALESQFLTIGPNFAAIPFVFLGGWIGTRFNNNRLTTWTCLFFGLCGVAFFFVHSMIMLIVLSFLIGIAAGILSPLSSAFIADLFNGKQRTAQYGYTSATLNLVLMGCVIATGYLAKINWRLPFLIYLLPFVPLIFAKGFGKYIKEPSQLRAADPATQKTAKVHYKFSEQVNMGMLIRYCAYYFFITLVIAAISLYIPFRYTNSSTAGDLTSVLFFGIMASGYTLNFCLRVLKNKVAIVVILCIAVGFLLMTLWNDVIIVGLGILIATYFYGIAQPYYYNRLSVASSRIALTLTLAWFASMDSIGNVVAPFIIDGIAKIFHASTQTHPIVAFRICLWMCVVATAAVIIRKIY